MDTQTIMLDRFVKQAIMADDMPWFIGDGKTTDYYNGDDNTEDFPQLTHLVYDGEEKSKLAPPIMRELQKELNIKRFIRIKLNLLLKSNQTPGKWHTPHVDWDIPHKVCVLYVNQSDGDTVLFNELFEPGVEKTEFSIQHKITPEEDKALLFDGKQYHASCSPITSNKRVVLNVDYEDSR